MSFRVCSQCVMDSTDPEINYDEKGICNHCRQYEKMEAERKREKPNLPNVLKRIKEAGRGNEYDCIIGLSGGVDSSYTLHLMVQEGLRPLTYSVDNGWNTQASDENIMRIVEGMKVPFYRYVLDIEKFKDLQGAFLKSGTANLEVCTDHILMAVQYEMAKQYNIKYIISGGNVATESVMPDSWGYNARDARFIKSVFQSQTGKHLKGLPLLGLIGYLWKRFIWGIAVVNLLDFYEYKREEAKNILEEKYGWKDYGEKHNESEFTKWFQNWYLPKKFGFDKRKAHYSSLILSGQMARVDAMKKLLGPLEYPVFGIESKIMRYQKRSYKDYPNSKFWWDALSWIFSKLKMISRLISSAR